MAKKSETTKVAHVTKNADSIKFAKAPVYNLANVRRDMVNLIVKASNDPKKVEAIAETIAVLKEFLDVRAEHAAEVRTAAVAAAKSAEEAKAVAAARVVDAKHNLKAAEAGAAKWSAVLADLMPAKK